jgi:hypothetical protein
MLTVSGGMYSGALLLERSGRFRSITIWQARPSEPYCTVKPISFFAVYRSTSGSPKRDRKSREL